MSEILASPITSLDTFRDLLTAYRLPRVILSALELDLFTALGKRARMVAPLAAELKVSERGLEILCRNLAMCGLLTKKGPRYRNSPFAATALNARDRAYRGAYLELLKSQWHDWSRLTEAVRTGSPLDHDEPEVPGYRRQFTWAMHHRSVDVAAAIAKKVNLGKAGRLLDLGGGPATYALAFLAEHPALRATVCDRPEALEVAQEIARPLKAGARLSYLPLDFMRDPVPGQYDVIWYSNVLHIYSAEENQALFERLLSALKSGGRLIIQDAFLHDREGLYPEEASLFAVTMLLFTERGNTYSLDATSAWLRRAGYVNVKPVRMKKGTEDWDGGLLQAQRPRS
ncbi:MAG: methyltransferase domain-containing protein [Nitrospiraceae bacterium]|nr:methyltransferase domain-containing protein [Nitrospiraceae bacterium]